MDIGNLGVYIFMQFTVRYQFLTEKMPFDNDL